MIFSCKLLVFLPAILLLILNSKRGFKTLFPLAGNPQSLWKSRCKYSCRHCWRYRCHARRYNYLLLCWSSRTHLVMGCHFFLSNSILLPDSRCCYEMCEGDYWSEMLNLDLECINYVRLVLSEDYSRNIFHSLETPPIYSDWVN